MTVRRSLSPTRRLAVFERAAGRCHICDMKIQVGQKWEVEHVIALTIGGADDEWVLAQRARTMTPISPYPERK